MEAFVFLGAAILVLKVIIFVFARIDYFFIAFVPIFIFEHVSDMIFFESNIHIVFKILMVVGAIGIWWVVNNAIRIGEFYPFKVVGAILSGIFTGATANSLGADMVWSVVIGVAIAVISVISRYSAELPEFD